MTDEVILHSSGLYQDDAPPIYTEEQLLETYGVQEQEDDWKESAKKTLTRKLSCSSRKFEKLIREVLPPVEWLPNYKIRENLVRDIIAGLTVGIVHLPQGMAYGLLASLPAVTGLYVSFFPVLIYVFFGTSRHISIGTFAVVSLMIAQVVNENVTPCSSEVGSVTASSTARSIGTTKSADLTTNHMFTNGAKSTFIECEKALNRRKIEIAVALAMANGIIQVVMSILRLGIVTTFLSTHLVSGFTCGAAFHVLTSQVPKLLGISVDRLSGPLALIYTYVDLFKHIAKINWATVIISVICITFLAVGKVVNAKYHDKIPIPLPWELAVVIFGTMASYFGHFNAKYHVQIVDYIPTGIEVSVPKASDIGLTMFGAFPIAIVSFATEISLSEMFATKHSYKIDSNQELLAMGLGNMFGSFFSCFPASASLSRSVICEEVGARTQLNGFFSSALILIILLWIGPLFKALPQAALAAIIVVNLKGLLKQFERVPRLWRLSKLDALTWVVTWASVVLLGVSLGLIVAVIFQVFTVVLRTQTVKGTVMGPVGDLGEYRGARKYLTDAKRSPNVIIFRFPGPVIFVNKESFKSQVFRALGFDPTLTGKSRGETEELVPNRKRRPKYLAARNLSFDGHNEEGFHAFPRTQSSDSDNPFAEGDSPELSRTRNGDLTNSNTTAGDAIEEDTPFRHAGLNLGIPLGGRKNVTYFILDMSCCPFIDNDGAKTIRAMHLSFIQVDIKLFLASCNAGVREILNVECEKQRPPFFTSVSRAMDVANGKVVVDIDETGKVLSVDESTRDTSL